VEKEQVRVLAGDSSDVLPVHVDVAISNTATFAP
jgi:hypothetical protein